MINHRSYDYDERIECYINHISRRNHINGDYQRIWLIIQESRESMNNGSNEYGYQITIDYGYELANGPFECVRLLAMEAVVIITYNTY